MTTGGTTAPEADRALSRTLSALLRAGVWLSGSVAAFGGISYLWTHAHDRPDFATFRGDPSGLTSLTAIAKGLAAGQPAAFMQLAVVLLVATPIACVAVATVFYLSRRDWKYATIGATVLAGLAAGLMGWIN